MVESAAGHRVQMPRTPVGDVDLVPLVQHAHGVGSRQRNSWAASRTNGGGTASPDGTMAIIIMIKLD
ncbi:hypothetical protein ACQPZZ_19270 [Microbispora sp. CA-135349]|uniref:hypothetical protein n=1 Tax=Microbispora sp. CA-135349 TaxID=3239953 RepID=UPI003D943464